MGFTKRMAIQDRVKHVFVLMLENRSYDHVFGYSSVGDLAGNEGNDWGGQSFKFTAGADFSGPKDPGHSFLDVVQQLTGATTYSASGPYPAIDMSGFAANFGERLTPAEVDSIFKGFTPTQLPVLNQLATEFGVCRRWFSSMPGPTWPNRFFVHAGTSGGLDDMPSTLDVLGQKLLTTGYAFSNGTIFQRLKQRQQKWTVWEGDETPQTILLSGMIEDNFESEAAGQPLFRDFAEFSDAVQRSDFDVAYNFIEPAYSSFFGADPRGGRSMHPIEDVTRAEQLVKWVYDAIRRSPHWNQSLLIIVFDEHGGFYDHIRPPAAAAPNDGVPLGSFHRFDFRQLGVRVPCVIVSPWIPKGYIDETVRDHTSILRTIEEIFELDWLTDRDHGAESLSPLLSASSARNDALPACANPATSGIVQSGWFQQVLERITAFLGIGPASASKPTPLAEAFIHIAGRREVQMQQDSAPAVEERIRNISTQAEAARYVESVRRNYRRARATLNRS